MYRGLAAAHAGRLTRGRAVAAMEAAAFTGNLANTAVNVPASTGDTLVVLVPELWRTRLLWPLLRPATGSQRRGHATVAPTHACRVRWSNAAQDSSNSGDATAPRRLAHSSTQSMRERLQAVRKCADTSLEMLAGTKSTSMTRSVQVEKDATVTLPSQDDLDILMRTLRTSYCPATWEKFNRRTRRLIRHELAMAFRDAVLYSQGGVWMDVEAELAVLMEGQGRRSLYMPTAEQREAERIWLQYQRVTGMPRAIRQVPPQVYVTLMQRLAVTRSATEASRRLRVIMRDLLHDSRQLGDREWNAALKAFATCGDLTAMERVWQMLRADRARLLEGDAQRVGGKIKPSPPAGNAMVSQRRRHQRDQLRVAFNTRMHAYAERGALDAVERVWQELLREPGLLPDTHSWVTRINAHARYSSVDSMERVIVEMTDAPVSTPLGQNSFIQQARLVGYARAGRWDMVAQIRAQLDPSEAHDAATLSLPRSGTLPTLAAVTPSATTPKSDDPAPLGARNVYTYTTLMSLQMQQKDLEGAARTLRNMMANKIRPTSVTVNVLLQLLVQRGDLAGATRVLDQLVDGAPAEEAAKGLAWVPRPDAYTTSILIDACAQQGDYEEMRRLHQLMIALGVRFTVATLTALALGYSRAGWSHDARLLAARARDVALTEATSHKRVGVSVPVEELDELLDADAEVATPLTTADRARGGSRTAEAVSLSCAVLRCLSEASCFDGARAVWRDLQTSGLPLGEEEHNAWLHALTLQGDADTLRRTFNERIEALERALVASQEQEGEVVAAAGDEDGDAATVVLSAVRVPPANVKTFAILMQMLSQTGQLEAAEQLYSGVLHLANTATQRARSAISSTLGPLSQLASAKASAPLSQPQAHSFWRTHKLRPLSITGADHAHIFSILVSGHLRRGDVAGAQACYQRMASQLRTSVPTPVFTALMDASARVGDWPRLHTLFRDLLAHAQRVDVEAYNVLLRAHTHSRDLDAAWMCLTRMHELGGAATPNAKSYGIVIAAALTQERSDMVRNWLLDLGEPFAVATAAAAARAASKARGQSGGTFERAMSPLLRHPALGPVVIRWYARQGNMAAAIAAYERIDPALDAKSRPGRAKRDALPSEAVGPSLYARNALMAAHAQCGDSAGAQRVYDQLVRDGHTPDARTFAILLTGCRRAVLVAGIASKSTATTAPPSANSSAALPDVVKIWRQMRHANVTPNRLHACRAVYAADSAATLVAILRELDDADGAKSASARLLQNHEVQSAIAEVARRVRLSDWYADERLAGCDPLASRGAQATSRSTPMLRYSPAAARLAPRTAR
ncbi:hypothetical protein THASP1DRAFT_31455 [Thamnocephalis sphaerospora]|uniref:Pentacotripeptide-repeat region of PRORP domain-containing protein n=1 Tax=Thamnocephalis sphaerospora TaxID=78915 RepID=A0A4P9XLI4_9FUNG|nr:hypothetical protein THASP1DRAFT_31455 [Thamnocephalis sphaerospora]|eukprot:RKP06728.1 hypothetical protein THASP1DRAFT_31455 [Thamnocephalis sphaerospora]